MTRADVLRFISKLTIPKIVNASKLLASYYLAKARPSQQPWGLPMTLSIEPTTACNLRCPECPSGLRSFTRPTGTLSQELYRKVIHETADHLMYLIFYFQGEPYIHPSFLDMVQDAHSKNIYTITSTNGHFLDDHNAQRTVQSGLDRLIISLDGTTQEVYEQYRKEGSINNVIQGAKNIVKWKRRLHSKTPHTIFQFLVVKPNEHQLHDAARMAKEIGVDEVKYKTAQLYDYENGHPLMPSQAKYNRYRQGSDGKYVLKTTIKNECWKMWHASLMTWDGHILPCSFDKDGQHQMGQLRDRGLADIWRSQEYRVFRTKLKEGRANIDICKNCSEGCKVWA